MCVVASKLKRVESCLTEINYVMGSTCAVFV